MEEALVDYGLYLLLPCYDKDRWGLSDTPLKHICCHQWEKIDPVGFKIRMMNRVRPRASHVDISLVLLLPLSVDFLTVTAFVIL